VLGEGGETRVEPGWVSPTYGRKEPSSVVVHRQHGDGDHDIVTVLLPAGDPERLSCVWALGGVRGGRGVRVERGDGGADTLLVGAGGVVEWEDVRTDARWLVLRRSADGALVRWMAVGASRVAVGGADLLAAPDRRRWAAGGVTDG
jgi:hypothetical protein